MHEAALGIIGLSLASLMGGVVFAYFFGVVFWLFVSLGGDECGSLPRRRCPHCRKLMH